MHPHAGGGRGEGIHPLGEQRAEDAAQDVPGARGRQYRGAERADRGGPVGRGDDRVVALQHDDRLGAPRRVARALQPLSLDGVAVGPQQPAELARVRREDRRRAALRERLQVAGVRVQAVGIEDEGDAGAAVDVACERERVVRAAEAGPEDERSAALGGLEDRVGAVRDVVAGAIGQRRWSWPR